MVKNAHHPAGLNEQCLGEVKGQRAARQGPRASPHLSSWKELKESEKWKRITFSLSPFQKIAKGISVSWRDLEYKL